MKTNKSYLKRVKITKSGKLLTRKAGQDHFNAKESNRHSTGKGGKAEFHMGNKDRSRYLVGMK